MLLLLIGWYTQSRDEIVVSEKELSVRANGMSTVVPLDGINVTVLANFLGVHHEKTLLQVDLRRFSKSQRRKLLKALRREDAVRRIK